MVAGAAGGGSAAAGRDRGVHVVVRHRLDALPVHVMSTGVVPVFARCGFRSGSWTPRALRGMRLMDFHPTAEHAEASQRRSGFNPNAEMASPVSCSVTTLTRFRGAAECIETDRSLGHESELTPNDLRLLTTAATSGIEINLNSASEDHSPMACLVRWSTGQPVMPALTSVVAGNQKCAVENQSEETWFGRVVDTVLRAACDPHSRSGSGCPHV